MRLPCLNVLGCFGQDESDRACSCGWFRRLRLSTGPPNGEVSKVSEVTSAPRKATGTIPLGPHSSAQDPVPPPELSADPQTKKEGSPEQQAIYFTNIAPDIPGSDITFRDTSFFKDDPHRELPSPQQLTETWGIDRRVIIIKELNLAVKRRFDLGSHPIKFEEAQAMRAISKAFPNNEVPVPEVFAWKRYDNHSFLYMSLVEDRTLFAAWPSLTQEDKESATAQLANALRNLRRVSRPPPSDTTICSISGGLVQDYFLRFGWEAGPFETTQAFNNWVMAAACRRPKQDIVLDRYMDGRYRDHLPDDGSVVFTHADLHMDNIMVSGAPGSVKLTAIIDWEQAGWYPEYWEYCKLKLHDPMHEWHKAGWAEKVLQPYPKACVAVDEYHFWKPF